eukprot:COSAG01_NODE_12187_length_1783_cov_3.023159_2_plen_29_part_01
MHRGQLLLHGGGARKRLSLAAAIGHVLVD